MYMLYKLTLPVFNICVSMVMYGGFLLNLKLGCGNIFHIVAVQIFKCRLIVAGLLTADVKQFDGEGVCG